MMKLFSLIAVALVACAVASPAVASGPGASGGMGNRAGFNSLEFGGISSPIMTAGAVDRVGFDAFLTSKTSFSLGGHYVITELDPVRISRFTLPAAELWGFGGAGSNGFTAGGGLVFPYRPNGQLTFHLGIGETITPGGKWVFGGVLTLDITPKHTAAPQASTTLTVISGPGAKF